MASKKKAAKRKPKAAKRAPTRARSAGDLSAHVLLELGMMREHLERQTQVMQLTMQTLTVSVATMEKLMQRSFEWTQRAMTLQNAAHGGKEESAQAQDDEAQSSQAQDDEATSRQALDQVEKAGQGIAAARKAHAQAFGS